MKNIKYILLFAIGILLFTDSAIGQENLRQKQRKEKIKTYKIAYISEALELTEEEAIRFWPIYNAREKDHQASRIKGELERQDFSSNQEADQFLNEKLQLLKSQYDTEVKYIDKFKQVLSSQKVAKLILVEQNFKDRMVETVRKRVRERRTIR